MSFSIVMLTQNNMEQFYKCIHSMFFYIGWDIVKEIVILDNGSDQKELLQFLKQLDKQVEKINVVFSDVNLGVAKGRKQLFDITTGDYIVSLDSDVIVINPPLLLETIQTALELEDMYLVGGAGADFPCWPSIERKDVLTIPIPDEGKYTTVDDVAGWFQAFKSVNLTKNGGKLYMDEQFSPFWAEDSDFSFQVKQIGKKSCILGHGLIFHAWSSCDKPETRITADHMWEKLKNKWYKINNC